MCLSFLSHSNPRLLGRAEVLFTVQKKDGASWINERTKQPIPEKQVTFRATLDGYSAPLTCGNFVQLVQSGTFRKAEIVSTQRGFYAHFRPAPDPNRASRQIPLEILPQDEPAPIYGMSLDDAGIGDVPPRLPVSAFGAMAMFHSVENVNDASDQFYVFTLDPASYQARSVGGSILTGSVATFGYITEGYQYLNQLQPGDFIASANVATGMQNFKENGN